MNLHFGFWQSALLAGIFGGALSLILSVVISFYGQRSRSNNSDVASGSDPLCGADERKRRPARSRKWHPAAFSFIVRWLQFDFSAMVAGYGFRLTGMHYAPELCAIVLFGFYIRTQDRFGVKTGLAFYGVFDGTPILVERFWNGLAHRYHFQSPITKKVINAGI